MDTGINSKFANSIVAVILTNDAALQDGILYDWLEDHQNTYCITGHDFHIQIAPFGRLIVFEMENESLLVRNMVTSLITFYFSEVVYLSGYSS